MGRAAASLMQQIFPASQGHGVSHFVCFGFGGLGDARECDRDIPSPQPKIQGAVHAVTACLWGSIVPGSVRLSEGVCSPVLLSAELLELESLAAVMRLSTRRQVGLPSAGTAREMLQPGVAFATWEGSHILLRYQSHQEFISEHVR